MAEALETTVSNETAISSLSVRTEFFSRSGMRLRVDPVF